MLVYPVALLHQRPLQDHSPLLVPLVVLGGELVHPAQFSIAVLAEDVPHHVAAGQHHPVHHLAVVQVHHLNDTQSRRYELVGLVHLVEEEGAAGGPGEPGGDELAPVGQHCAPQYSREQLAVQTCVAGGAGEKPGAADVFDEDPPHPPPQPRLLLPQTGRHGSGPHLQHLRH